jgi:hypothetical protein
MILLLIILVGGAGWGGYRIGVFLLNKKMIEENTFLRNHVEELKLTIKYWSEQSSYNKQIHNTTIANHNSNISHTLQTLTTYLQTQNKENLHEGEKEKIESIIKSIKGISI